MTIVEQALETWREAERLLDRLPPIHPDHESVVLAVASLRDTYRNLTDSATERTPAVIDHSRGTIERTRQLLDRVYDKLDRDGHDPL